MEIKVSYSFTTPKEYPLLLSVYKDNIYNEEMGNKLLESLGKNENAAHKLETSKIFYYERREYLQYFARR